MSRQDYHYYRHGTAEAFLVPSHHAVGGNLIETGDPGNFQVVPNRIYATPLLLPRATTIDGVYHMSNAVASGVTMQCAIYGVECLSIPLPGRIISQDVTSLTMRATVSSPGNYTVASMTQAYAIGGQRLMWLAALWTGSANVRGVTNPWAMFGYDPVSLSVPLTHVVASWNGLATLPNTYPGSWSVVMSTMPALGIRVVG